MGKNEDKRFTKPNLKLVNKANLDRVLKAEIYVNEADGQLRATHLILGYTPLSFTFQAPKCVIKARDPRLHRISVAFKGFIIPKGIPLPQDTSRTEPLFVAVVSIGASSSQPVLREEEVEKKEEKEEEEEEVVELSDSSEDFGVFDQPIRSEEDLDEMGIQRKPQRSLMELIENQPGGKNAPGKSTEQKGKDVVDVGKSRPTREEDAQRAAKQQKTSHLPQRGQERFDTQPPKSQAWLPAPMHAGEPLRNDASIRDFNGGIRCHVIQNTFKLDERLNICYSQLDDEKKKWASAVQTLTQSEQDLADARKKLLTEEQAHKSADSALEGYQKQTEDQGKRLHEANAELKTAWEQVAVLKKHLEETQKLREQAEKSREEAEKAKVEAEQAMNEAEQKGYEIGVAETEETLKAEVPMVCPPPSSQAEDTPSTINPNEGVLPPSLPPPGQPEPAKGNNAPPEASLDKTAAAFEAEVASQGFQQDLASTVMSAEGAAKDKEGVTTSEADKSTNQAPN
ncbi:neurofilament medium polypeptide-like [Quercus lobata]|uniref:neurofilament medium polypeptide-like n=1 Tax=Quercus lobata TaxID=97700 RepID=UPI001243F5A7|nr:neurofilament medium polypeptide-like [Quercus lobata]